MTNYNERLDKIDQEITDILLEHLVLANDNGQPYIQYTDVAVDKIITLIATQKAELLDRVEKEVINNIRITERVLLDALIDLFCNPPSEVGASEDIHLHSWQIEKMLQLSDEELATLDKEIMKKFTALNKLKEEQK